MLRSTRWTVPGTTSGICWTIVAGFSRLEGVKRVVREAYVLRVATVRILRSTFVDTKFRRVADRATQAVDNIDTAGQDAGSDREAGGDILEVMRRCRSSIIITSTSEE